MCNEKSRGIVYDILIPAYLNLDGVKRLLESLIPIKDRVRVVISDDSPDGRVIAGLSTYEGLISIVLLVGPKTGAVANWNFLLSFVEAPYFSLCHHDESFIFNNIIDEIESEISSSRNRLIILPCCVEYQKNKWRYISSRQKRFMIEYFCNALPVVNFIGPTACLVVPKDYIQNFDKSFKWYVDNLWYYQLINSTNCDIKYSENNQVISAYYPYSITRDQTKNVRGDARKEYALMRMFLKKMPTRFMQFWVKVICRLLSVFRF